MATAKFEMSMYDGRWDFNIWSQKMRTILIQMKCAKALDNTWPAEMSAGKKTELEEIAWSTIFLYISDSVIRTIGETKTAEELWTKLKAQYEPKTIPNKCFLLKQFFSFKMDPSVDLDENLDRFTKLTQDLANCDEKLLEDQLAVVLLNSISDRYRDLKNALKYGRDNLTIDIIINTLRNKVLELKSDSINHQSGENLLLKGKNIENDRVLLLKSARFVPELERNLVSLGMLNDMEFDIKLGQGYIKIFRGTAVLDDNFNLAKLWHYRLGHIGEKGLKALQNKGIFGKSNIGNLTKCEQCLIGKQVKLPFPTSTHKSKQILEYLHADLWGPASTSTLSSYKYYLLIINDLSRKFWVFLLKTKDETFVTFKD
ncbi:uncharacterized protein LOC111409515 [Olea europaea var. sylvestris]|uniref:uncharacterized protein LOC111409515 n=1 Tax=Olea europaea var. sylvestris TaxID=158386 RepID=UPI000C1CD334|nr:uncharacterized protein LOC111409515 [Olea europaea var. sylvestris]